MLKIWLALTMVLQAPVSFAKPSVDIDFVQIERTEFEQEAYFDALAIQMHWSAALKFRTLKLFDAYQELAIIGDESSQLETHVRYLTRSFAVVMRGWSIEIAKSLNGTERSRYKNQNIFGHKVLGRLASETKFRSERVRAMFEELLPQELESLESGLNKEIKELQRQASATPAKPIIHWNEVVFGAMFGELTNVFLRYIHVPGDWSTMTGLLTFAAFYLSITSLKAEASPVNALQMAIKFHNDIECENMLEFGDASRT